MVQASQQIAGADRGATQGGIRPKHCGILGLSTLTSEILAGEE
jgi:hypothetical protein